MSEKWDETTLEAGAAEVFKPQTASPLASLYNEEEVRKGEEMSKGFVNPPLGDWEVDFNDVAIKKIETKTGERTVAEFKFTMPNDPIVYTKTYWLDGVNGGVGRGKLFADLHRLMRDVGDGREAHTLPFPELKTICCKHKIRIAVKPNRDKPQYVDIFINGFKKEEA